jgi:hypothetical protein
MAELDEDALTAAHQAVEDELVDLRDRGMWAGLNRNGFVINERDGTPSSVMRMGTRYGLTIAIRVYLDIIQHGADISASFTPDEVEALVLAAAEAVCGQPDDLSERQVGLATRAYSLMMGRMSG